MVFFKFLDRFIDSWTLASGRQLRKLNRKISIRSTSTYHLWVVYMNRRRRDKVVKFTVLLLIYCFWNVARASFIFCNYFASVRNPGPGYFEQLRRLDEYNIKGRVDQKHDMMITPEFTREEYIIAHDYILRNLY